MPPRLPNPTNLPKSALAFGPKDNILSYPKFFPSGPQLQQVRLKYPYMSAQTLADNIAYNANQGGEKTSQIANQLFQAMGNVGTGKNARPVTGLHIRIAGTTHVEKVSLHTASGQRRGEGEDGGEGEGGRGREGTVELVLSFLPFVQKQELTRLFFLRSLLALSAIDLPHDDSVPTRRDVSRCDGEQDEDHLWSNGIEDDAGEALFGGIPFLEWQREGKSRCSNEYVNRSFS